MSTKRIDGSTYSSDGATGTWETDLLTDPWDKLSIQLNYTNAEGQTSFDDGVKASGTITVTSFAAAHLTAATGTVTVVDYTQLAGKTVTVRSTVLTEGVDWNAATDNDTTAASLELAIEAVADIDSSATNAVITVVAHTKGTVGNGYALATDADPAGLTVSGAFLTGGINAAVVTVAGHTLTESTDWNSVTNNNTAADNLAAAIDALSEVTAANPAAAVITVVAAAVGTAGNAYDTSVSGAGVTVQQATLTGGTDSDINDTDDEITIVGHGYETGDKVNFDKLTGTVPTGLTDNTDYWIIAVDDDTIQLADSYAHAIAETALDIAGAAAGGGTFTLTPTAIGGTVTLYASNDGVHWVAMTSPTPLTISANGSTLWESVDVTARYVRVSWAVTDGSSIDASFKINAKGEAN